MCIRMYIIAYIGNDSLYIHIWILNNYALFQYYFLLL